ncbi:hypothetical protein ACQPUZ_15460 [Clostridium tertium]
MNKVEIKLFLGEKVRVVNNEWLILQEMFKVLGRLNAKEQISTGDRKRVIEFLELLDKSDSIQKLTITSKGKSKKSREIQEVTCIKIENAPIVLTQFEPISSNRRTKEENEAVKTKWFEFMKFVNELLVSAKAHKFIVEDTELEKIDRDRLHRLGGKPMIMADMANTAMGVIITGEKIKISKPDLKSYQNQITIDLLECRRYFIEEFIRAYKITKSHSESNRLALEFTLEHYGLNEKVA